MTKFKMGEYVDFMFEDEESGECFFVELRMGKDGDTIEQMKSSAFEIALDNFENPDLIDILSNGEADIMGLDTY